MTLTTLATLPQHIAVIMDGNGRWAQKCHMHRNVGHAKGVAGFKALVKHYANLGVKYLSLFAFSTENWSRPADEVSTLMGLFLQYLEKEMGALAEAGVRLRMIGDVSGFTPELESRFTSVKKPPNTTKPSRWWWTPTSVVSGMWCQP